MIDIKVYDNVLDDNFIDFLTYEISFFNWAVQGARPGGPRTFFYCDTSTLRSHNFLFHLLGKKYNLNLQLLRSYVNLNPSKNEGEFHRDDGELTMIYYPLDWKDEFKGGTIFKRGDYIKYVKNRLLLFDSSLSHKADINLSGENRYSIAWKTKYLQHETKYV